MPTTERKYTFKCPMCEATFAYDQPAEPMCTGPGALTQHEPTVMFAVRVDDKYTGKHWFVNPEEAVKRSQGTLWLPWNLIAAKVKINGELWRPKKDDPNWTDKDEEMLEAIREAQEKEE